VTENRLGRPLQVIRVYDPGNGNTARGENVMGITGRGDVFNDGFNRPELSGRGT